RKCVLNNVECNMIQARSLHDALPISMGQLSEQKILILGLGGIGKEVARKAIALGAEVYAVANSKPDISGIKGIFKTDDLKHVIGDRKSTRLNSSHDSISYAVFCLKKK